MLNETFLIARRRAGLSQVQLGDLASLNQKDISKIEMGWTPPVDAQERLSAVLGVSVAALFNLSADLSPKGQQEPV